MTRVIIAWALGGRAHVRGGAVAGMRRDFGPSAHLAVAITGMGVQCGWDVRERLKDAVTLQSMKTKRGISFCRQPSPTSLVSDGSTHARSITRL